MEIRKIKITHNKSGSGSTSNRIVLPSKWIKLLDVKENIIAIFDGDTIILKKG